MTYIVEKSAASLANQERTLITIEFAPNVHPSETEYQYEHPKFVFSDRVTLVNEYPSVQYTVIGMELIESKTPSGRLLSQPRWRYKITDGKKTFWKEESALLRYTDNQPVSTRSAYQVGSLVKVIDSQEHHSEWAVFEITECHHNQLRYRTTEAYISEIDWYYIISSLDGVTQLEVSEIEICDVDLTWNTNT